MFRQSARGLFDLLMASMAIWTFAQTPSGEVVRRSGHWLWCRVDTKCAPSRQTALLSYFGNPDKPTPQELAAPEPSSAVANAAQASGAAPSVLQGFVAVSTSDLRSPELALDSLTPEGKELLAARGASAADLAGAEGRLRAAGQAIVDLTRDLGSADAALCALVVGEAPVEQAVERVRAERLPPSLEAIAPHLPPGARTKAMELVEPALGLATVYDLAWPVPRSTRIASHYGWRVDPVSGARALHNGVDLSVASGTPISATGEGVVVRAGEDSVNGKFLIIDHHHGVTTGYCHNSELLVARGDGITRSMVVTHSGNTGRSTGPHLHYTVALAGVARDPEAFLTGSDRAAIAAAAPPRAPAPPLRPAPVPAAAKGPSPALLDAFAAAKAGGDAAPSSEEAMGSDAPGIEAPPAPPPVEPDAGAVLAPPAPPEPDASAEVVPPAPPAEPDAAGP